VSSPIDLPTAFWTLMSQVPQPSEYVRALAQSFLTIDDQVVGVFSTKDVVFEELRSMVLPAGPLLDPANEMVENPYDSRFRIAQQVDQFVTKSGPSHLNQLRSFCQNRCRIRRNLCHALLEWDSMQADAEDIDGTLQTLAKEKPVPYPASEAPSFSYPLSSWIYHYKLMQLRLVVQMGFELSIYGLHEYPSMYWYLSHTASLHLSHLERMSYFVSVQTKKPNDADPALRLLFRHFSYLKAVDTLASALHCVFVVLQRHGHVPKARAGYASDELRFELRMRPFQYLSIPEPLSHKEMQRSTDLGKLSDRKLLDQAARLVQASKKAWEEVLKAGWSSSRLRQFSEQQPSTSPSVIQREWTRDIKNSMKSCIGTSITITSLIKSVEEAGTACGSTLHLATLKVSVPTPEDTGRFHAWWAVPKIAR
jgi:N-alpha-acetyltransferase 35, NatC auxiliary subunit